MERRRISRMIVAAIAVAALSQGCALFGGADEEDLGAGQGGYGAGTDSDFAGGGRLEGESMGGEGMAVEGLEAIYFDYDRSLVRDDQKPTLRANASSIQSNASWRTIVIEGHCDERGSEEYNLALGERRANAARQYLIDSGIEAARLDTVSFGESKPAVQGHDESAWRWNRRAEFRVIR